MAFRWTNSKMQSRHFPGSVISLVVCSGSRYIIGQERHPASTNLETIARKTQKFGFWIRFRNLFPMKDFLIKTLLKWDISTIIWKSYHMTPHDITWHRYVRKFSDWKCFNWVKVKNDLNWYLVKLNSIWWMWKRLNKGSLRQT